jgi:hypothetical protein
MDIHAAEPLAPGLSSFVVENPIAKLKKCKLPGINLILAELIQVGAETLRSEVHKVTNCIWIKEELPQNWKKFIIIPDYGKGNKLDCSNYQGVSLLSISYRFYPLPFSQG